MRVHRRSAQGKYRHHLGVERASQEGRSLGGDRLHGRALRRRTSRQFAGSRPDCRLRRRDRIRRRSTCHCRHVGQEAWDRRYRTAGAIVRPVESSTPCVAHAVGLCEDCRGLRPQLRVLCDSVLPWPAAQPRCGQHPARSRRAAGKGNRARCTGLGQLRQGSPRRTRCRFHRRTGSAGIGEGAAHATVVFVPERSERRTHRRHPRQWSAVLRLVAAARVEAASTSYAPLG